ncbi:MAG: alkaline phosphatase PhoX [Gemmatimonadaceae bacterium]
MNTRAQLYAAFTIAGVVGSIVACSAQEEMLTSSMSPSASLAAKDGVTTRGFEFAALPTSAVCTAGGDPINPLVLPVGFQQSILASEPSYADAGDMNTQNENGIQAGRYLYRVHEVGSNGSLSVTDLLTGVTKTIAQRIDWESLDPTAWTPWGTLLFAEETNSARFRDPDFPDAVAGLVYEVFFDAADPTVVTKVVARPAIGSKSHEGMRFDPQGNLYSISERTPGYIFKFVPDTRGDLSSGQTYVLKITQATGDRTGAAEWIPLDRAGVQIDASAEADKVQATGYGRPEDVEIATSTGSNHGGSNIAYVAITSEHRVLAIDLREPKGGAAHATAFVTDYVSRTTNATAEFEMPDNLALDRSGNLFIAEDPGGNYSGGKRKGDDIWVAAPVKGGQHQGSPNVTRFATLTDCDAEPTGIYFDLTSDRLFVNVQHRGGDRLDKTMGIVEAR